MKKLFFTILFFSFFTKVKSQTPYFINDINNYVTVYDSTELQNLPLLNIGAITFANGIDTNFIGIVDPAKKFKRLLDYPYPTDTLVSGFNQLFLLGSVNNGSSWSVAKINTAIDAPLQPTGFESIMTFDSLLNLTNTVTMSIPYSYMYHGRQYNTSILYDVHNSNAFNLNGSDYILAIGTHLEWYDASGSWIDQDSMRVRFSTLHIIDAINNIELARWEPQHQGYTLENFGLPKHLQTLPSGLKYYSHPHINVIEPQTESGNGVNIYASSRHPGIINKLFWDGVNTSISPIWMFGYPQRNNNSLYLETITTNQLDACHGASAFVQGDTTFIATYNNKPENDAVGGRHQVWEVVGNKSELIWQTPDIGVQSICKGYAKWSADGRYLLTTHGNCNGNSITVDNQGDTIETNSYEKFQIWNPWTNTKVAGIYLTGTMYVAMMEFIDEERILSFEPIEVSFSDSIKLTHTNSGLVFWTIGNLKYVQQELSLPLSYSDSLDEISAWIKTGYTGAWRVTEKNITIGISENNNPNIALSTIQKIGDIILPARYNWLIHDIFGTVIPNSGIETSGVYIIEGYDQNNILVYRKKHIFIR